ncbi:helix-turn-helix domain-containing protein [Duganella sp. PWIR1]
MVELDLVEVTETRRNSMWRQWHTGLFRDRIRLGGAPARHPDGGYIRGVQAGQFGLYRIRTAFSQVLHGAPGSGGGAAEGSYAAVLLLSGNCTVSQAGRVNSLSAGDMVFLHTGQAFQKEMQIGSELMLFTAPSRLAKAQLPSAGRMISQRFRREQPGVQALSRLMRDTLEICPMLNGDQCQRMMAMLLDGLHLPALDSVHSSTRDESRLYRALQHLDSSVFDSTFNTEKLAAYMCVSRRRLDEIFVSHLGHPVSPLIWERRLERAATLLRSQAGNESTVTDIAFTVGFENVSHFSRVFKKRFGCTPLAWRNAKT